MTDLRREAEAAGTHFGTSEEGQARAMAHLTCADLVQRREEFFASRRVAIRRTRKPA
jgi:BMFP domain-containing protein YqiC